MNQKSYVKCLECQNVTLNSDYCSNCGALINVTLKRKLEQKQKNQIKLEERMGKKPGKIEEFLRKLSEHPNAVVRFFSQTIYSIWLFIAMIVGGLIAAIIAAAAG